MVARPSHLASWFPTSPGPNWDACPHSSPQTWSRHGCALHAPPTALLVRVSIVGVGALIHTPSPNLACIYFLHRKAVKSYTTLHRPNRRGNIRAKTTDKFLAEGCRPRTTILGPTKRPQAIMPCNTRFEKPLHHWPPRNATPAHPTRVRSLPSQVQSDTSAPTAPERGQLQ